MNIKKIVSFVIIAALFVMTLAACGQAPVTEDQPDKLSIVSTIFPSYDFARQITGDLADVTMLLPPGGESHSFEPTLQDIAKIQNCGVFLYGGGESDAWVEKILASIDTSNMRIVTLMDCVEVLDDESHDEPGHIHSFEEEQVYDEHVWTSPRNAKLIVQEILKALCEADAENAPAYLESARNYLAALDALDQSFQDIADNAVRRTIIFGDRFPFLYFTHAYALQSLAAFPGCSHETQPSAAMVKQLIDKINAEKIPVVFHLELSDTKMAETISEATGAKVLLLHACHNISKADFAAGKGYLDFMEDNLLALRAALH